MCRSRVVTAPAPGFSAAPTCHCTRVPGRPAAPSAINYKQGCRVNTFSFVAKCNEIILDLV